MLSQEWRLWSHLDRLFLSMFDTRSVEIRVNEMCIIQALWCRAITFRLVENIEIKNVVAETCINKCLSKPSKLKPE